MTRPVDVAVLIDHERQAAPRALELRQLLHQRGALGNEVGFARGRQLDQPLARERAPRKLLRHALHVQDAHQVAECRRRKPAGAMRCLAQALEDILPVARDVDGGDILALES